MACGRCASSNQKEFPAEICVHLPDLSDLTSPPVLLFPKLLVCLRCGFTEFTLPEGELSLLAQNTSAIASLGKGGKHL